MGICAGLAHCDKRALLLIQQTGMLDSINAIRGVAVEYSLPICMMVGLLEKEPGVLPQQSKRYGVRIVEPILDAMGITHHLIETDADLPKIRPAIDDAYAQLAAGRAADRPEAVMMKTRRLPQGAGAPRGRRHRAAGLLRPRSIGSTSGRIRSTTWRMAPWGSRPRMRSGLRSAGRTSA